MSAAYDIQTYLLDRANIHDTIFRMGRYELQLERLPELEGKGRNPWRIRKQKVAMAFQDEGAE